MTDPSEEEIEAYTSYVQRKEEAHNAYHQDCLAESKAVVSLDLEKILQFPRLETTKQTFYKSRFVLRNMCFFLLKAPSKGIVFAGLS